MVPATFTAPHSPVYANTCEKGRAFENIGIAALQKRNWTLLQRNIRIHGTEIDAIFCNANQQISFVEFKSLQKQADICRALKLSQQKRILKAAQTHGDQHELAVEIYLMVGLRMVQMKVYRWSGSCWEFDFCLAINKLTHRRGVKK